jgi:hypothetical protein
MDNSHPGRKCQSNGLHRDYSVLLSSGPSVFPGLYLRTHCLLGLSHYNPRGRRPNVHHADPQPELQRGVSGDAFADSRGPQ